MIRSTHRWMTALATAALLALPWASWAQTPPPASQQTQQPSTPAAAPDAQSPPAQDASRQPSQDTARRHLTEARNALSQLTQLPAAGQLSGDARTQVSQLITNFNELITTQSNWRAAYAKVDANLTALLGPASGSAENPPATPVPTAGAAPPAGVAGTSGTTLDPTIKEKLAEVRTHLNAFTEAAGAPAAAPSDAPAAPPSPTTAPPPSAPPAGSPPAASPDRPASAPPAAPPAAAPDKPPSEPAAAAARPTEAAAAATSDAMRHIEAIEAILGGGAASTPDAPSAGRATLTAAQIEQIRQHLAELKKAVSK